MKSVLSIAFFICCSIHLFSQSNWLWARNASCAGEGEGWSVSTDGSGNVFVTGFYASASITFGSVTLTNVDPSGTTYDVFIAKYDANGNVLWARNAGGAGDDKGISISANANGNVFVTGLFLSPTIAFGSATLSNSDPSGNTSDIFIAEYDAAGNMVWAHNPTGTGNDWGNSVSADANGNVFATGFFSGPLVFGSTTLTNFGVFVAKYDASGNVLWAESSSGTTQIDQGFSVSADGAGNVVATGWFSSSSISFGSTTLINAGIRNIFLVKYDANGNVLWAKSAGGIDDDEAYSASVDAGGNVFITGSFESPNIVFGPATILNSNPSSANTDIFIFKYDVNGNPLWAKCAGGPNDFDEGYSICADASGNVFVTGGFRNTSLVFGNITLQPPPNSIDPMFIVKYSPSGNVLGASALASGGDDFNGVSVDASGDACIAGDFAVNSFVVGQDVLTLMGNAENVFVAKYHCDNGEAVNEFVDGKPISIFPNPSNGNFILNSKITEGEIFICNVLGEIVFQSEINSPTETIDLSNQPAGIYFVQVKTGKESFTQKVIIE